MKDQRDRNVVAEIKKRHGSVIDLDKSPGVIIEIIHNFRYLLDEAFGPDGTGGAPGSPPDQPSDPEQVGMATVLNLLLELRREVRELNDKIQTRSET